QMLGTDVVQRFSKNGEFSVGAIAVAQERRSGLARVGLRIRERLACEYAKPKNTEKTGAKNPAFHAPIASRMAVAKGVLKSPSNPRQVRTSTSKMVAVSGTSACCGVSMKSASVVSSCAVSVRSPSVGTGWVV